MDINNLKLYNKYKDINNPNTEFIYIGIDNEGDYWFLYKTENANANTYFAKLKYNGLDPDKIVKELNLETFIYGDSFKFIKGYDYTYCSKEYIEINLKPLLKDKLNNILNR
jgi:hypothetical protein